MPVIFSNDSRAIQSPTSLSKNNRVIVYVWFSKADGGDNVGHAALQTPNYYISLWPGKNTQKSTPLSMLFEHREEVSWHTYEDDVRSEDDRPPECVCCLYSLDVSAIEKKFSELVTQISNWSVLGNTQFNRPNNQITMSCSSLVYDLLMVGGISKLTMIGLTVPRMPSPHNIFTIVRNAKQYEFKQYPETQSFDETDGYVFNPRNEVYTMAIIQAIRSKL